MKEQRMIKKRVSGMRKIICLLTVLFLSMQLAACNSTELAEGFDEDVIKETAEEIINDVQLNGAKQVLMERMREDYVDNIDLDTMENTVVNLMKGKGDFIAYSRETVIGRYHEEAKEDFGVILVTATFEKGEINYTITFDKEMKVVGFYAK